MPPAFSRLLPHLALLVAMLFWSTSYPAMRIALTGLDPVTLMFGRMLAATLVLLPVLPGLWRALRRQGGWGWLLFMGLCEPGCYFLLEANAMRFTTASQAGMIVAALPLFVGLLAWLALRERVGRLGWLGFGVAVAGVIWLTLAAAPQESAPRPVLGNLLEGLAIVCGALYTVTARHLSARYSPLQITLVQSLVGLGFFGTLCLLASSTAEPVNLGLDLPSWAPWACVVYLGCVVSLGGYGLYNVGVHGLSAAQAAAYTNLIPVMTLIIGVCFLHEVFLPSQYAASLLVIAGVLLSQWRRRG